MDLNKKIGVIFLSLSLSFGLGCSSFQTYPQYHIKKKINGEKIHFYESLEGKMNYLDIIELNGILRYIDYEGDDLKIDAIAILDKYGNEIARFDKKDKIENEIILKEQKNFDKYLKMIRADKIKKIKKDFKKIK